jgi:hypothetical protein
MTEKHPFKYFLRTLTPAEPTLSECTVWIGITVLPRQLQLTTAAVPEFDCRQVQGCFTLSGVHPPFCPMHTADSFSGDKPSELETDHSPISDEVFEVKGKAVPVLN